MKICGIARTEDARRAVELGAWSIGLIFHPASPRRCEVPVAEEVASELRREVEITGVFCDAPLDEVAATAERCSLAILQLHGNEGPAYCREAARRTGCRVMKAVRVRDASTVRGLGAFRTDYHLLDTHVLGLPGGTGERFDWDLARVHDRSVPLVMSGGLTAENVGEVIALTRPFGVDTASGTEASPGVKDDARLQAFFRAVGRADAAAAA